ncbi:sugar ABC transporter ATP-binding protein [Spiroplasma cantharicola]|uniref:Ribose/galactose/methyl galactoside import ATP-binding protein n=1 Tax=Spiroplasma cantharicola TaxID=362837 RepID=A0A0M3SJI4_9MOLU|nr:sugar ABC transporter ATP-binding protein [Spiroplasma cantharicola]ALD66808.1 ribose ABC transporter ATP-binding protein [Spiroplasma cantharicola]
MEQKNTNKSNKKVLVLKDITKKFGDVVALKGVNLNAYLGKCMGVLGENGAGKSTLMNIISGVYKRTSGYMIYNSKKYEPKNIKEAEKNGIVIIHQELNTISEMTVMDNIFLGSEIKNKFKIIKFKEQEKIINKIFDQLKIYINPYVKIGTLSIAQQQLIEIAKAVIRNANVIIMDEPTSSLSNNETLKLFEIIKKMKEQNKAIIYISHRLQEIPVICEDMTIIRDGEFIGEFKVGEINEDEIITKMVGRNVKEKFPKKILLNKSKICSIKNVQSNLIKDVSFDIYNNEILGFAGLVGAKRTELFKTIIGQLKDSKLEIILNNKKVNFKTPSDAIKKGFYYVTEDRKVDGLFLNFDIKFNITISSLRKYKNKFIKNISTKKQNNDSNYFLNKTLLKAPDIFRNVSTLSGGNQQKVLIAKALSVNPKIIIFDEPTRGVDVGARKEIYDLILEFKMQSKGAVIIISNDLPEIIGLCDSVIVMKNGTITKQLDNNNLTQEEILKYAI